MLVGWPARGRFPDVAPPSLCWFGSASDTGGRGAAGGRDSRGVSWGPRALSSDPSDLGACAPCDDVPVCLWRAPVPSGPGAAYRQLHLRGFEPQAVPWGRYGLRSARRAAGFGALCRGSTLCPLEEALPCKWDLISLRVGISVVSWSVLRGPALRAGNGRKYLVLQGGIETCDLSSEGPTSVVVLLVLPFAKQLASARGKELKFSAVPGKPRAAAPGAYFKRLLTGSSRAPWIRSCFRVCWDGPGPAGGLWAGLRPSLPTLCSLVGHGRLARSPPGSCLPAPRCAGSGRAAKGEC